MTLFWISYYFGICNTVIFISSIFLNSHSSEKNRFLFFCLALSFRVSLGTHILFYLIFCNQLSVLFVSFNILLWRIPNTQKRWKNSIVSTYIYTTCILQLIFYYTCFLTYLFTYVTLYPPIGPSIFDTSCRHFTQFFTFGAQSVSNLARNPFWQGLNSFTTLDTIRSKHL